MIDLDRFAYGQADPQEAKIFCECNECGGEIYEGEEYHDINGWIVCDNCLNDWLNSNKKVAGEE